MDSGRNNFRRHPGVMGKRPDKAEKRKVEAIERNAKYAALPIEEKMSRNPKKFKEPEKSVTGKL